MLINPLQQLLFPRLTDPAPRNAIPSNNPPLIHRKLKGIMDCAIVIENITAEISRIVTVDGELDSRIQEFPDGDLGHGLDAAQSYIRQGANCKQDSLLGDALQQDGVLDESDTMVDTCGA